MFSARLHFSRLGFSTFSVLSSRLTWIRFERFWFGFSDSFSNYLGKLTFHYFRIDVAIPRNSVAIPRWFAIRTAVLPVPSNTVAILGPNGSSPSIALLRTAINYSHGLQLTIVDAPTAY